MMIYCWSCGAANESDQATCVHCGAAIGDPSVASAGPTDSQPSLGGETPDFVPAPSTASASPAIGPEPPSPEPEQPAAATEPAPSTPQSPRSRPRGNLVVAVLGIMVVALAVALVVALVTRQTATAGDVTPTVPATPAEPTPEEPPATLTPDPSAWPTPPSVPGTPPVPPYSAADCGFAQSATVFDYYHLGQDRLPTLIATWELGRVPTCLKTTDTSVQVTYDIAQDQWGFVFDDYIHMLQADAGFTPGPLNELGGYLWGRSIEAGKWLLVRLINDPGTGMTVIIQKGSRDLLPNGLVEGVTTQPQVVSDRDEPGSLAVTAAPGWGAYDLMWMFSDHWDRIGLRYNKVSQGAIVGTLAVMNAATSGENGRLTLRETGDCWVMTAFSSRAAGFDTPQPVQTKVQGYEALKYSFTLSGTAVSYVFVQAPHAVYMLAAEVDLSDPHLLDEVQQMVDSATFSG